MFYNYNISIVGAQYHIYKLNLYNNIIMMIILYPWWVCKTLVIIIVGFTFCNFEQFVYRLRGLDCV